MGRALIAEGLALVAAVDRAGPLGLQAAIAAEHARAASFEATDWRASSGCYDALLTLEPSPTIAIGRCVALSYVAGPEAGLADLDEVLALGDLDAYPYAHAARADSRPSRPRRRGRRVMGWPQSGAAARRRSALFFDARRQAIGTA